MHRKPLGEAGKAHKLMRRFSAWIHSAGARCTLVLVVGAVILFVLFCAACTQQRYDLSVGSISHQTITATKAVQDTVTTESRRSAAALAVEPTYHLQPGASESVMMNIENALAELRAVQQYGQSLLAELQSVSELQTRKFTAEELQYAKDLVQTFALSDYSATVLMRAQTDHFDVMAETVRKVVESELNSYILEGKLFQSIQNIRDSIGLYVEPSLHLNIIPVLLNNTIQPNMVIDAELTEAARQAARDAVEPVVYLQGQNIVRAGERVNLNQLEMLRALGLLENNSYDLSIYGGAALLTAVAVLLMFIILRMLTPDTLADFRAVSVIVLVMILAQGLSVVLIKVVDVYLAPVALGAILLTALLGGRVALAVSVSLTVLISGLTAASNTAYTTEMLHLLLTGILGSTISIRFLRNKPQRLRVLLCGLLVALGNLAVLLSIGLMTSASLSNTLEKSLLSMGGGIISALLAMALQPLFEAIFNLATPSKLMELANPEQPLLRRLLLEAPGTYHHSIIVANLSEAAAEKIGANPLLARTGAYFHDIGKLKRPLYFKENQMGENPHDRTDPYVSSAVVTSHTRDGLQLAIKHRLPLEVQQIITQHHGDTPVMYFYHKALQQADGKPVDIADFRYDGMRPRTKESAIVMLADTIEAAVRSMPDPTPQAIERFIERLVRGKLEDGQLSSSPLTLKDIDGICEAFCTVLNGVFHERIEYPNVQVPKRSENAPKTDAPGSEEAAPAVNEDKTEAQSSDEEKTEAPAEDKTAAENAQEEKA